MSAVDIVFISFFTSLGGWLINFIILTLKYDRGSSVVKADDKWFSGWRMYVMLAVPFMSLLLEIHAMLPSKGHIPFIMRHWKRGSEKSEK